MRRWSIFVWCIVLSSHGQCQYLSRQELTPEGHDDGSSGWDIRLAVPGEPGRDYPVLNSIPKTGFSCAGKDAGYYADVETNCQVFRVCTIGATFGFQSFLCPNGTLFNQKVSVCDWWMNVNCQGSQKYYNDNSEKFGQLRLGPSMMQDIKKMLTYPMNNPYKKNMNDIQVVMQVYVPPSGQPFSNGFYSTENIRNPQFPPAQQLQLPLSQNSNGVFNENQFSASTPSPQYVPGNYQVGNFISSNGQLGQLQNGQYNAHNGQYVNFPTNGNDGTYSNRNAQFEQLRNEIGNVNARVQNGEHFNGHYTNGHIQNLQYNQGQNAQYNSENAPYSTGNPQYENGQKYQFSTTQNSVNLSKQNGQYNNGIQSGKLVEYANSYNGPTDAQQQITQNGGQAGIEVTFTKQHYTYPSQYDKQITYTIPSNQHINKQLVSGQVGEFQEVKQNLVSEPSLNRNHFNTKSLYSTPNSVSNINKEQKSSKLTSTNAPTSRVTFKTWVVRPSKSGRLIEKTDGYKYERPSEKLEGYNYERPSEKLEGYKYDKPAEKLEGYKYERPKLSRQYLTPTTAKPTIASRLYLAPTTPKATIASRLYLAPSRPTLASRLYLAPTTSRPTVSSRLYLVPSTPRPYPSTYRPTISARLFSAPVSLRPGLSARLVATTASPAPIYNRNEYAAASTLTPVYYNPLKNKPTNHSFTITKHSRINTNHNNLTFTDILTKEKLDITVNDIVKDTSAILQTNSANNKLGELREEAPSPLYVPTKNLRQNLSAVLSPSTVPTSQSARLTKNPSNSIELPVETFKNVQAKTNQITSLPYFKPKNSEPEVNTRNERTVSLHIDLPERTVEYILKSKNDSEFDRLEILNTGRSNYLVLTNNAHNGRNFIPLGKLVVDKTSNFSYPQAYVYDFLANSINAAKSYENSINENVKKLNIQTANTFGQPFQNIDADDLNDISERISQLTTAQYNNNNFLNNQDQKANLVSTAQTSTQQDNTYRGPAKFINGITQTSKQTNQIHRDQLQSQPNNEVFGNYYSSNFNGNNGVSGKLQAAPEEDRAGRLYQVPNNIVTHNINQLSSNNAAYTNANSKNVELGGFEQIRNNVPTERENLDDSRENAEVELVDTEIQQNGSPAKLQAAPTTIIPQVAHISNSITSSVGDVEHFDNENAIGAKIQKQFVVNHPLSDKNLLTYKADKSYYVYTKFGGSGNNGPDVDVNNRFGELRAQQNSAEVNVRNGNIHTTVQFIPSLGFQLDDDKEQQKLIKVLQNQQSNSADYKSSIDEQGYGRFEPNIESIPTSNVGYSVQHAVPTKQTQYQQYRYTPDTLYAGPSSYSAPQASVGRLEVPQRAAQLNAAPSTPSSSYVPAARLEEFEDTAGYPKVTPAIPFTF